MRDVAEFRATYRAGIGRMYSGWTHFAFTSLGALGVAGALLAGLRALTWREALTLPATFLFANLVEYLAHRGPMHHRRTPLGLLFQRHTLEHHHFFTHEQMACESPRDFRIMLFPPALLVAVVAGVALPGAWGLAQLFGPNVGRLFGATAVLYYLTYEWLHFAYHLPPRGLGSLGPIRWLRRHHAAHHDPHLMQTSHFNITFPIFDTLFGTSARVAKSEPRV
jgi:sterol desaturase/sphingolipid hydroxylase (fatty acid hydroxylase superfamily)